jgi:hypothetical protein
MTRKRNYKQWASKSFLDELFEKAYELHPILMDEESESYRRLEPIDVLRCALRSLQWGADNVAMLTWKLVVRTYQVALRPDRMTLGELRQACLVQFAAELGERLARSQP